jgi:Fe-S oxidoreductase/nitrate reductase gamma subunit
VRPDNGPLLLATSELTREVLGNHSPASRLVFYVLSLVALGVFGWGIYRRARLWRLGRPSPRGVPWWTFLGNLIRYGLLQKRVLGRGKASLGHLLLFAGFVILFLGTTLLSIEHGLASLLGRRDDDPVFHKGVYYAVYEMTTEAFGLALLAGGAVLAVRRWRRPPSLAHHWSDWAVLGTLLVLGVTGYVVEGLRIIREQTPYPAFSFVGWLAAQGFAAAGVTSGNVSGLHFAVWWFHAILALGFVAVFPYTRLLHALAGAARLGDGPVPLGVMIRLDAEEVEHSGVIGASKIRDLSRRQLLELDACVSCGRCEDACPAFEAGKPLSPRDVVQDLRQQLDKIGPGLRTGGKVEDEAALAGGIVADETLWSCTTCSACTDVCPLGVNPLGMITDLRRNLIGEVQLRGSPAAALQKTDRAGNPWGLPARERLSWAAGLDVPTVASCPDFEVLYWVGCAAAYEPRAQRVARSVVKLLKAAGVRFAVLGAEERCTGETARRMGDEFLFQQLAAGNVETLARYDVKRGARKIVTHCPHCLNSFRNDYPQMGGDYEVLHHTELLSQLAVAGRLPMDRAVMNKPGGTVTYHDPCYLARVQQITEPPRKLLELTVVSGGGHIAEMPRSRRQTSCCGAGGGRMWFDDGPSQRIGRSRVQEALASGAQTIAVSCPFCLIMVGDGVLAQNSSAQVRDIAELMAEALLPTAQPAVSSPASVEPRDGL